jgi:hypothetical protein
MSAFERPEMTSLAAPGLPHRMTDSGGRGTSGPNDRCAGLLVGVWLDNDSFRARLTSLPPEDEPLPPERLATVASPGDVLTAVHAWLDAFLEDTERHDGG